MSRNKKYIGPGSIFFLSGIVVTLIGIVLVPITDRDLQSQHSFIQILGCLLLLMAAAGTIAYLVGRLNRATELLRHETELRLAAETRSKEAVRTKTQFLAGISHEIRTPLNSIVGFSDVLRSSLTDEDDRQHVERIYKSSRSLLTMISDLLDFSHFESGRVVLNHRPFELNELMAKIKNEFAQTARENNVQIQISMRSHLTLVSDEQRLHQILSNLIGNAIRASASGLVQIAVLRLRGERFRIEVTDSGPGLSGLESSLLFEPFSQTDLSIENSTSGTEIGLLLSRQIARAMGGDLLMIESRPGEGTRMRLEFPVNQMTVTPSVPKLIPEESPAPVEHHLPSRMTILIADDMEDNRALIAHYLKQQSVTVEYAVDGKDAFHKASLKNYDLIVMDIQMPEMTGSEVAMKLRKNGYGGPIVALSANAMKQEISDALKSGFEGYLVKPITKANLMNAISKYTRLQAASLASGPGPAPLDL